MLYYLTLDLLNMSYYNEARILHKEELAYLGTIVCQDCQDIINFYEEEKVTTLYSTCPSCTNKA